MITRKLAEFSACDIRQESARQMMRLSLFDWANCAIAGKDEPVSAIARNLAEAEAGQPQASLIASQTPVPARAAALVNGATSHALDFDDTHFAHIGHPSVAVIPAALAAAELSGARGDRFLDATLVGAEASIRVGAWLGRGHYQLGFHQTATAGAFGATIAAGRVMGLNTEQMAHALGYVSTRASGLKDQFGTMGKPMNAGIAASNGVEAALLAQAGLVSSRDGLGGPLGFGATHAGAADARAWDDIGAAWMFETVTHKYHACCHGLHAMLEALTEARALAGPVKIAGVTITTHPRWGTVCNIAAPATGLEAKFSYRHTAAMCVLGVDTAALESYTDTLATSPEIVAMRLCVTVNFDDALPETAARVQVQLAKGQRIEVSHDLAAALPIDERTQKLRAKASALNGASLALEVWDAVQGEPDLGALTNILRRQ